MDFFANFQLQMAQLSVTTEKIITLIYPVKMWEIFEAESEVEEEESEEFIHKFNPRFIEW